MHWFLQKNCILFFYFLPFYISVCWECIWRRLFSYSNLSAPLTWGPFHIHKLYPSLWSNINIKNFLLYHHFRWSVWRKWPLANMKSLFYPVSFALTLLICKSPNQPLFKRGLTMISVHKNLYMSGSSKPCSNSRDMIGHNEYYKAV